jgi:hypothetical protein
MMNEQTQTPSTNGTLPNNAIQAGRPASEAIQGHRFEQLPAVTADLRAANRRTLIVVLMLMAGMAILGLTFALWTVPYRRANDFKSAGPPSAPPSQPGPIK